MILPNLYLTDVFTARGVLLPAFASPGRPTIKYILSILDNSSTQPQPAPANAASFVQKLIILDDAPDADLLCTLPEACAWIEACLAAKDGGVLVHCQLGQSRSASVVIGYMMRAQRLDFETVLEKVRKQRSVVRPNPGFQVQLRLWGKMEYDVYQPGDEAEREEERGPRVMKELYVAWKEEQGRRVQGILES